MRYGIKMICYDADEKIKPYEKIHSVNYEKKEEAENIIRSLAEKECDELNRGGNKNGNYFEVEEYEEFYFVGGDKCVCHCVSVVWYDKAPNDRENDCQIRVVTGYEVFRVTLKWAKERAAKYTKMLKEKYHNNTSLIIDTFFDMNGELKAYYRGFKHRYHNSGTYWDTAEEAYEAACKSLGDPNLYLN